MTYNNITDLNLHQLIVQQLPAGDLVAPHTRVVQGRLSVLVTHVEVGAHLDEVRDHARLGLQLLGSITVVHLAILLPCRQHLVRNDVKSFKKHEEIMSFSHLSRSCRQ